MMTFYKYVPLGDVINGGVRDKVGVWAPSLLIDLENMAFFKNAFKNTSTIFPYQF